ncbi:MAG: tetratricopeptide repeat protein [Candidatus Omnitrophica bacterium]|nr:tetratricopeptide repeat protein [Candidatus Omnitrophota bacterium]
MKPFSFTSIKPAWIFLIFLFIGLLAYGNAINHPFVHDDTVFIVNNPNINNFDLNNIFQSKKIDGPSAHLVNVYYRPLIELLYRVEYKFFGLHSFAYHLFNIIIHVINACLLYVLLLRIFPSRNNTNIFIPLFFLIHPIQTEAVACISGISNLFLTLLMFSSFWLYLKSREEDIKACYVLVAVLFFLGCLVKEQMIVFPILILLYEWIFHRGKDRKYVKVLGLFLVLVAYFLFRKMVLGTSLNSIFDPYGEYVLRFKAIPRSLLTYFSIIFVPINLHYYRSVDVLNSNVASWIVMSAVIFSFMVVVIKAQSDQRKIILFGAGWFFITLFPMLNIVPLVNEYSTILNFEHFLYIPLVGILIVLSSLFEYFFVTKYRFSSRNRLLVCIILVLMSMCLTIKQNTYWRSEIALFTRALKFQESGRLRILLGKAYYFNNDFSSAVEQYRKAEDIMQSYIQKTPLPQIKEFYQGYLKGIYFDLAHCYESLQNNTEAIKLYQQALSIDPKDVVLFNNLAVVYIREQNIPLAMEQLEKALFIDDSNQLTRQNLAYCYFQMGEKDKAEQLMKLRNDNK